jgi:D-3-phosphoglycerate dehydrogenase
MDTVVESLIVDLLDWVALRERTYEETIEAWRTSCPKLPVWEEARERKLIAIQHGNVCVTDAGFRVLDRSASA